VRQAKERAAGSAEVADAKAVQAIAAAAAECEPIAAERAGASAAATGGPAVAEPCVKHEEKLFQLSQLTAEHAFPSDGGWTIPAGHVAELAPDRPASSAGGAPFDSMSLSAKDAARAVPLPARSKVDASSALSSAAPRVFEGGSVAAGAQLLSSTRAHLKPAGIATKRRAERTRGSGISQATAAAAAAATSAALDGGSAGARAAVLGARPSASWQLLGRAAAALLLLFAAWYCVHIQIWWVALLGLWWHRGYYWWRLACLS
jgi:hypothetical protein